MHGLSPFEIEARLMLQELLEPISRGPNPLAGPKLHAERLVEAWKAAGAVALADAYQLLDVGTVAGVILRTVIAGDYDQGHSYWNFPPVADLLPPLREVAWQKILAGELVLEAIKGVTGRRHRPLAPAELPRLIPDFELSRLVRDGRDEFVDVRVRRMPATDIPRPWQGKPSQEDVEAAASAIAKDYPPPAQMAFTKFWAMLKARVGSKVTKRQALDAQETCAPHLKGRRGHKIKSQSS